MQDLRFFYPNPLVEQQIKDASVAGSQSKILVNKIFNNPILAYSREFSNSIYRSVDPVVLFTISDTLYESPGHLQMMYPIEILLFFFSLIYTIRNLNNMKRTTVWMGTIFGILLVFWGLFLPPVQELKNFPVILLLRIWFCINLYYFFKQKKLFS